MADAIIAGEIYGRIYCITNSVNGKQYVGLTVHAIARRWRAHCDKKDGFCLHNAIAKYGKGNFTVVEIDSACCEKELQIKEREWIARLKTIAPSGYNLLDGGGNGWDVHPSTRKKISVANKRAWSNPVYKAVMIAKLKKNAECPEWRLKMSEVSRAVQSSPELRKRRSILAKEYGNTPEEKARRSASTKAVWSDAAKREKIMAAHKAALARPEVILSRQAGRTAEWRKKLSVARAGKPTKPCSPETREKIGAAHRGKPHPWARRKQTPEDRLKKSIAAKERYQRPGEKEKTSHAIAMAYQAKKARALNETA